MKQIQFSSLPEEIILSEILPRVSSVKSLLRFKCVSKSWFSLISTNKFVKTQLQYSQKNTPITDYNAILVSEGVQRFALLHCPVASLFSQLFIDVDRMSAFVPRIVGCCNGICCVLINNRCFILWNPSTQESRRLPLVLNKFVCVTLQGFGYDESNDDYKVVAMLRTNSSTLLRLYSLKTNSWKTINDFLGLDTFRDKGVLVNGKFHWMSNNGLKIVSFDLGMEAVGVVEPPSLTNAKHPYQRMGVIKGCLCVMRDNPKEGTEVWVMREYGVKESWCRVMTVPYIGTAYNRPYSYILCISEDGVVLKDIDHKSTLFIYNPNTKLVKYLQMKVRDTSQVDFCIQSLCSPFHHGELEVPN